MSSVRDGCDVASMTATEVGDLVEPHLREKVVESGIDGKRLVDLAADAAALQRALDQIGVPAEYHAKLCVLAASASVSHVHERGLEGVVQVTIAMLQALPLTAPKLKPKLLSKPPFRYLHEIVKRVAAETGFAPGLFTAEEFDCATITTYQTMKAWGLKTQLSSITL